MSLGHAWSVVDPKKANTFLRKGKHKEIYMKCGTLNKLHIKWVNKIMVLETGSNRLV